MRRVGPFLLTALVAAGVGYWSGRKAVPERLETKERLHEEVKLVERMSEVETKTKQRTKVVNKKKYRKDGTLSSETTSITGEHLTKHADTKIDANLEANRRLETSTLVVNHKADWRLTALLGTQLQNPLTAGNPNLLIGLSAERRILGPFWGGLFVAGTFPARPGVDLRREGALYGGLSLSLEF